MASPGAATEHDYDVVVVGAGTAGLPCAIKAAEAGARVLLIEKDSYIGGTLHLTSGHMAAAGTRHQRAKGIEDTPQAHLDDIRRISGDTARNDLVKLAVDHAADTLDWLEDHGFVFTPESPILVYGHEPYTTARTSFGVAGGESIFEVLESQLKHLIEAGNVTVWTQTPVMGLHISDNGRVGGVEVLDGGDERTVSAAAVVLATGGFAADKELFEELDGAPLVSAARRTSTGDAIHIAHEVNAGFQGKGTYMPTFGGLPDTRFPGRAKWEDRQNLTVERPPLEIYVDPEGQRWVAEDDPSMDAKEHGLAQIPSQTFWTVFDEAMLEASTGSRSMIIGYGPEDIRRATNTHGGIFQADTIEGLARQSGVDPAGLAATVARYNESVRTGVDPDFGRTHLPMEIAQGPFYAIQNHGVALLSFTGLDIDASLAVRDQSQERIDGLYAIGEVIGAGATCGRSFCSGMLVTPALTFGRILGERLGAQACMNQ